MNIGSAKITKDEMDGIPHFLIDELEPTQDFNVSIFQQEAKKAIEAIYSRNHIPIIVGGTGFYIQSVLYDITFGAEEEDTVIRDELECILQEKGNEFLHNMLAEVDPEAAKQIHANNGKRVIRAIEFFRKHGQKISEHNEVEKQKESAYKSYYFVLTDDREKLYQRINDRVDKMIEEGLVEEVKRLKEMGCNGSHISMQALGYKEILDYLNGEITLEEAIYLIKRDTRHFAKRQLTWFRREKDVIWLSKSDFQYDNEKILAKMVLEMRN